MPVRPWGPSARLFCDHQRPCKDIAEALAPGRKTRRSESHQVWNSKRQRIHWSQDATPESCNPSAGTAVIFDNPQSESQLARSCAPRSFEENIADEDGQEIKQERLPAKREAERQPATVQIGGIIAPDPDHQGEAGYHEDRIDETSGETAA